MANAFPKLRDGIRSLAVAFGSGQNYYIPSADNEPERNTYRAFIYNQTFAGIATDLVILGGSTTKIIRLKSLVISGTATLASNIGLYLFKRTAAATGGTPTNITKTPSSTTDPAATANLVHYGTGAPTVGAGTMLDGGRINLAPAANGSIDRLILQYTWQNDKAPMCELSTEYLALGMNGVSMPGGGALDISITWTEEDPQT
jgi:hypothetical protein